MALWSVMAGLLLGAAAQAPAPAPAAPARAVTADATGLVDLGEGAIAYIPTTAAGGPAPVLLLLHGAGGEGRRMIQGFRATADRDGLVLLAPKSAGRTWDMILATAAAQGARGTFRFSGGDADRVEGALRRLGERASLDPERVALAGFSDGASYALSLGPTRPDLYRALVAFSPGFVARPGGARGLQPVFIAHGRSDPILAYDRSRNSIVPDLRAAGHRVTFRPFDGGHFMPAEAIDEAIRFLSARQ